MYCSRRGAGLSQGKQEDKRADEASMCVYLSVCVCVFDEYSLIIFNTKD